MEHMVKEYDLLVNGKTYKVTFVEYKEGLCRVKVNDKSYEVRILDKLGSKPSFSIEVLGKQYNVELEKISRTEPFTVKVNDKLFRIELQVTAKRAISRAPEVSAIRRIAEPLRAVEKGAVVAPMAGRITSVRVKKGDVVKAGDILCVLEAMKMENEITAPQSGVVQDVKISEGAAVNEGEVLMLITQ